MNFLIKKSDLIRRHAGLLGKFRYRFSSQSSAGRAGAHLAGGSLKPSFLQEFHKRTNLNVEGMVNNLSNPQMVDYLMVNKQLLPFLTDNKTVAEVSPI